MKLLHSVTQSDWVRIHLTVALQSGELFCEDQDGRDDDHDDGTPKDFLVGRVGPFCTSHGDASFLLVTNFRWLYQPLAILMPML